MWRRFARLLLLGLLLAVSASSFAQQDEPGSRKVISRAEPDYPRIARNMRLGGVVKVEAVVAPNGTVKSVAVRGGPPILTTAAADAVRKWRWTPGGHETREPVEIKFSPNQ
jgi:TonB family protein